MDLGEHPSGLSWSADGALLASACLGGSIGVCDQQDVPARQWTAHPGGVLGLEWGSTEQLLSVGQDGRLCWWSPEGEAIQSQSLGRTWAEHVLPCGNDRVAIAVGKELFVLRNDGSSVGEPIGMPSTISDISLYSDGALIAVSHYGGVTMIDLVEAEEVKVMTWKGSLIHLTWHPQGSYLVASSQEQGILVFGMGKNSNCAIDNFPGKVHSMSWSFDGDWLAMAGGNLLLVWPFDAPGPVNRESISIGIEEDDAADWTCLAFSPNKRRLAVGNVLGEVFIFFKADPNDDELSFSIIQKLPQAVANVAWHPFQDDLAVADVHGKVQVIEGIEL